MVRTDASKHMHSAKRLIGLGRNCFVSGRGVVWCFSSPFFTMMQFVIFPGGVNKERQKHRFFVLVHFSGGGRGHTRRFKTFSILPRGQCATHTPITCTRLLLFLLKPFLWETVGDVEFAVAIKAACCCCCRWCRGHVSCVRRHSALPSW